MDEVPEGRAAAVVVAGEALRDEAACVDRFNIVFTETLGPIGAHRHQAGHQQTGDEAERHHGFLSVVDEQTEFVERSFLEHVWVRCTFHKRAQKKGVFESASWGSVDATMMKQATEIDRHDKDTVLAAGGSTEHVKGVNEAQKGVNEHQVDDEVSGSPVLEFRHGEGRPCLSLCSSLLAKAS